MIDKEPPLKPPPGKYPERTILCDIHGVLWVWTEGDWMQLEAYLTKREDDRFVCLQCQGELMILDGQYIQCYTCKQWYQLYNPYVPEPIYGEPSAKGWEGDKK